MSWQLDRRDFLRATTAGAGLVMMGGVARAFDLNGKLRVAAVGTGNRGRDDLLEVAASPRVEITALCDVDQSQAHFGWAVEKFPKAARHVDYRRMLDQPKEFDAVLVCTPDHMHAPISLAAMGLGKHVFCQKPLTHTVHEARQMREAAERHRLVTQMGNQVQSHHAYRLAVKLLQDGAIGKAREVHSWQSGDMWWMTRDHRPETGDPVPETLDWNLWLGVAPERPYAHKIYHPIRWRAWQDFSNGQLGDFGCHILDPVFMGLGLTAPRTVEAEAPRLEGEAWARRSKVRYEFPGTEQTAGETLPLTWYDGAGHKPEPEALGLAAEYELPGAGSAVVGESGTMIIPHWAEPRLLPEEKFREFPLPTLEDLNHFTSWAHACLGDGTTTSHFGYAGPLTEAVLLGTIAIRFPGEQLQWNAKRESFTHHADATALVTKQYRKDW